jgi:DNA-binding GntR family transcriptional regulator
VKNLKGGPDQGLEPLAVIPSLDEQVYKALLEAILSSKLAPGTPLVENSLARQLGVSKTPVRAALKRLEGEMFVRRGDGYRYCVADFRPEDVRQIFLVRSRLEGLAAHLATPRMTSADFERASALLEEAERALDRNDFQLCADLGRQFHQLLLDKAENQFLSDYLRRLNAHIERGRRLAALSLRASRHSVQQHRRVLEAMVAGDGSLAEDRMRNHVTSFEREIQDEPPTGDTGMVSAPNESDLSK